jgi:hypothetical protein
MSRLRLSTTLFVIACSMGTARASDPTAVYALIDKAVLEPDADKPERIQILGVFAMAKQNDRNLYEPAQRGYLYFKLSADKPDLARREWADLKKTAGKRQVVSFGNRYQMKVRVRKPDEKVENPDVYVLGFGVVRARSDTDYTPIKSLLEYSDR